MTDSDLASRPFKYSSSDISSIFQRDIYTDIIASTPFSRLKNIHFLGAIDYVLSGDQRRKENQNTRYHHSLGVARLALIYARIKNFNPDDEVLCVLAALLHDIGHAPFSHSMESVFIDRFNLGHHKASEKIIKGEVPHLESIWKIINSHDINIYRILMILNGIEEQKFRVVFDYPINIDTIEGILRCSQMIPGFDVTLSPDAVVEELASLSGNSVRVFDRFWKAKNYAYRKLICSELGVVADYLCQEYMRSAQNVREDFFYYSELKFQKKHSDIFRILSSLREFKSADLFNRYHIDYYERVFEINENKYIFNIEDLKFRYTQHRIRKHIDW